MLDNPKFGKKWELEKREKALPGWPLRGMKEGFEERNEQDLQGMIRCERRLGTHGFFVAVFVRKNRSVPAPHKVNGHGSAAEASPVKKSKKKSQEPKEVVQKERKMKAPSVPAVQEKSSDGPDFTLLRLATMDRKRRAKMTALRAVRKLAGEQHGGSCCGGCAH